MANAADAGGGGVAARPPNTRSKRSRKMTLVGSDVDGPGDVASDEAEGAGGGASTSAMGRRGADDSAPVATAEDVEEEDGVVGAR